MALFEHAYRTLLVSATNKLADAFAPVLASHNCEPLNCAADIASARRMALESAYDFVIINTPLPDEFGTRFALDISENENIGIMLLVKAEHYPEIVEKVSPSGILVISKPAGTQTVSQSLDLMCATRERLRRMERKTASIEEKMEEIRLVNTAKWLLVAQLKMTEPEAHRFIQKSAMDEGVSRRSVADRIIRMYG